MSPGRSCCGAPSNSGALAPLGCLLFLFPLYAATGLGLALAPRAARAAALLRELNRVALGMINGAMTVRLRCALSGRLYAASPRLAGAAFRYLNVVLLASAWALLARAVAFVV